MQTGSTYPITSSWAIYALNGGTSLHTGSTYPITSSRSITSSYSSTSSLAQGLHVTNGYVILKNVSSSLNFVDDVAAAAGGVPLGGLYRNGNFILIRIT